MSPRLISPLAIRSAKACVASSRRLFGTAVILLVLLAFTPSDGLCSQDTEGLLSAVRQSIRSEHLAEERPLLVALPPGYQAGEERYPVLVVLDAESKLTPLLASARWLAARGHLPELIVVGVVNTARSRDLTPPPIASPDSGNRAPQMLAFMRHELLPWIDSSYRTRPFRLLWGHSLGGMMTMHVLRAAPELFAGYIALSPDLARADYRMINELSESLPRLDGDRKRLYVAVGEEYAQMVSGVKRLESALLDERARSVARSLKQGRSLAEAKQQQAVDWTVQYLTSFDHDSILVPATHAGLMSIFERWRLPINLDSIEAVQSHYQRISALVGYPIEADEQTLLALVAYPLFFDHRFAKAAEMFRYAAERFPGSSRALEGLGMALGKLGRREDAMQTFQRALQLPELSEAERQRLRARMSQLEARPTQDSKTD